MWTFLQVNNGMTTVRAFFCAFYTTMQKKLDLKMLIGSLQFETVDLTHSKLSTASTGMS